MPAIIYDDFGGVIPKLDPSRLPPNAAQKAHNVELSSHKLEPIDMTGGFKVNHDPDTGEMYSQIPEGEVIRIPQPDTPTVAVDADRIRMIFPNSWTWVLWGKVFMEYFDLSGVYQVEDVGFNFFTLVGAEYTTDGFLLRISLGAADRTLLKDVYYKIYGPKFGFDISNSDGYKGGPGDVVFPDPLVIENTSPDLPRVSVPLLAPTDYTGWNGDPTQAYAGDYYSYGNMELIDISGPIAIPDWDGTQAAANTAVNMTEAGVVTFYFRCNYRRNKQQFVRYITEGEDYRVATGHPDQTYGPGSPVTVIVENMEDGGSIAAGSGSLIFRDFADNVGETLNYSSWALVGEDYHFTISGGALTRAFTTADDVLIQGATVAREGPPSDESDLFSVDPGMLLKLTVPRPAGCTKFRIFRSDGRAFRLLEDEVEADVYYDTFTKALGDELPPYGNFPHATREEAVVGDMFLGGRIGLLINDDELLPSEPDKLWIYPEEYGFPLYATILGGVGFLSSAIIFTDTDANGNQGKVYRVGGQHPRYWTRQLLSDDKPLLNVRSICTIDQTVFYVSNDGVIAVNAGGTVQNITEDYFNREEWMAYAPQFYSGYTRDSSIFLIHLGVGDVTHWRIDLNDGHARMTTFDGFNGGDLEWKGRVEESHRPIAFRAVQVEAEDYPIELTLTGDGGYEEQVLLLPDGRAQMLPRMRRCKEWEVGVKSRHKIDRIAVATNVQELHR